MLIPIIIACIIYVVYYMKMSINKSKYTKTKEKIYKDLYVVKKRQVDWLYDNFIFSFSLSLFYVLVFQMFIYFLSDFNTSSIYNTLFI